MRRLFLTALAVLPLAAALPIAAQAKPEAAARVTPQSFAADLVQHRMMEKAMANLAVTRSATPEVRDFARTILTAAKADDAELQAFAKAEGVAFQAPLSAQNEAELADLQGLATGPFDKYYADYAARLDQDTLLTDSLATYSDTPAVAAYARGHEPMLEDQRVQAIQLYYDVGGARGMSFG
jgi:predicted outer membrane protein